MRSIDSPLIPGVDFCVEEREARNLGRDISSKHVAGCPVCLRKQRVEEARSEGWSPDPPGIVAGLLGLMARGFFEQETDEARYRRFYARIAQDADLEAMFAALVDAELAPKVEPPPGFAKRMREVVKAELTHSGSLETKTEDLLLVELQIEGLSTRALAADSNTARSKIVRGRLDADAAVSAVDAVGNESTTIEIRVEIADEALEGRKIAFKAEGVSVPSELRQLRPGHVGARAQFTPDVRMRVPPHAKSVYVELLPSTSR